MAQDARAWSLKSSCLVFVSAVSTPQYGVRVGTSDRVGGGVDRGPELWTDVSCSGLDSSDTASWKTRGRVRHWRSRKKRREREEEERERERVNVCVRVN